MDFKYIHRVISATSRVLLRICLLFSVPRGDEFLWHRQTAVEDLCVMDEYCIRMANKLYCCCQFTLQMRKLTRARANSPHSGTTFFVYFLVWMACFRYWLSTNRELFVYYATRQCFWGKGKNVSCRLYSERKMENKHKNETAFRVAMEKKAFFVAFVFG